MLVAGGGAPVALSLSSLESATRLRLGLAAKKDAMPPLLLLLLLLGPRLLAASSSSAPSWSKSCSSVGGATIPKRSVWKNWLAL